MSDFELPGYGLIAEPVLAFHPDRAEDRSVHPLEGLLRFGPYSRSLINHVMDPIRLAVVMPSGEGAVVRRLIEESDGEHRPRERAQYLPPFPGFNRVFGVRLVAVPEVATELAADLEGRIRSSARPHVELADAVARCFAALEAKRDAFDVVLVYFPARWAAGFYGPDGEDFDLHDHLKAVSAARGLPIQVIREDRALSYACRASVMWRLGIALYVKAGGVPWKIADSDPDAACIGLSYAVRDSRPRGGNFVTCCSQVFDADGAGLEFLAYETDEVSIVRRNPFLSRAEMRRVMARSLSIYQRRHAGRAPRRIVVHKTTEFKPDEVEGCFDALQAAGEIELVQVKQNAAWSGIKIEGQRRPAAYPCDRGSYLSLGGRRVLLWTQGDAAMSLGKSYYKEGKGIPRPLELVRFAGHGGWADHCQTVLGLTKMDWNNDGLYDRLPVTLGYAQVLARTIKRMPSLASRPYQFRFFM